MASTYSNLKIQLMATGENATTWGDVTNINLGTAIEEAIVGSADVTFASANVTLSLSDTNTTQTARNVRLRCTGTTGGSTRNLVVPSIEKPYIVKNDCADSILVKTAAGTGITVPAGKTMWVYADGTNVVDAVTHLSGLTLNTALAVTQGGTGANTASDARTNLGLGTMSTQNASAIAVTGGTISNVAITGGTVGSLSTALAIADGGTGANTASAARTALGATTLGASVFTITNPSAITFPRFNADNTVSALSAADFRTAIGAGTGTGTVTSVSGTGSVSGLTLTGTVTSSGSLTLGGSITTLTANASVTDTGTISPSSPGFRGLPLVTPAGAYTLGLTDAGKIVYAVGNITVPPNSTTAFPSGTTIVIVNVTAGSTNITISSSDFIYLAAGSAGTRTLVPFGIATLIKINSNSWIATGPGLS